MKNGLIVVFLSFICCNNTIDKNEKKSTDDKKYTSFNAEALAFCRQNNFNQEYYFLIDLSIHSGRNRFFIFDFTQNKITSRKLVTHGSCDVETVNDGKWEHAKFSNKEDSHCSSKGKYKIGKRDYSSWGIKIKYWLQGLEQSNDNAESRAVVLHSWDAVSNVEIYPDYNALSWGCPAVSDEFMKILDTKLQATKKPVLLWIIE